MKPPVVLAVRYDDQFSTFLRSGGCDVLNLALIRTAPADDLSDLHKTLGRIENYDGLFFTSPVAARVFAEQSVATERIFIGKIYALGERAKTVLENSGFEVIQPENANTAEDLIVFFDEAEFSGKRMLFVRGDVSLRTIPKLLEGKATVDEVIVYKTSQIRPDESVVSVISERLEGGEIDWLCFFSPSGVESFRGLFALDAYESVKVAAIGDTTARKAREAEMHVDFVADKATLEDFAAGLIEHINNIE